MKTNPQAVVTEALDNVLTLPAPNGTKKRAASYREPFKIQSFTNPRTGTESWRVTGTKRDGSRVRENYADLKFAECRKVELTTEWLARETDTAVRATKLTDTQLRLAEAAFMRLEEDQELMLAVDHWLKDGKRQSVAESPRLDEAAEAFLSWLQETESLRERTKAKLRNRVNLFRNSVPNLRVSEIGPDVLDKFFSTRKVAALTKIGDREAISRFFSWCIDRPRRWTAVNPCREIRLEKKHDQSPPAILSVPECKDFLSAAESFKAGQLVPYIAVCLFGGLRPAEAQRLTWDSVNLGDGEIRVESQSSKTKRPRVLAIGKTLRAWLAAYTNKPFCPPNLRRDLDALKVEAGYAGRADSDRAGLKPWPADVLRHTGISHYFRESGSYGRTAEQFGNSEAIIKKHYQGRVNSEDTKAFYALLPKKGGRK
jgi:integrase